MLVRQLPKAEPGVGAMPPGSFELPAALQAHEPPEARGIARDQVRLLVAGAAGMSHAHFADLPRYLAPGDLVVVNTSGTLAAAVDARRPDGSPVRVHFSTRALGGDWIVELRTADGAEPFAGGRAGEQLRLPAGAVLELLAPAVGATAGRTRLWSARPRLEGSLPTYLERHGRPIRYRYVPRDWPLEAYQTVYATEPGSAEMPSAGRAFTAELVTRLVAGGVVVAPVLLHTGVSSAEAGEAPYAEPFAVPEATARLVNLTRAAGGRVVAVGTTVVRALETVAGEDGRARAGAGWTELVIGPERGVRVVDGLVTGFHEPRSSHLRMLEAIAGRELLERTYHAALEQRYLWHEFGDLNLLLP